MQKYSLRSFTASVLTALLVAFPLTACVAQNPRVQHSAPPETAGGNSTLPGSSSLDARLLYQLMTAELNYIDGNLNDAYILILKSAQQSGDPQLYERAVNIALQAKVTGSALTAAQEWKKADPTSRDANRYILDILISMQRYGQITDAAQSMIRLTPDEERPRFIAALGQYLAPHAKEIEPRYQAILSPWLSGTNSEEAMAAWVSLSIMKLSVSKLDEAYAAIEQAHTLAPEAPEPILAAVSLIDSSVPQAEELVQAYLKNESADQQVRLAYIQTLLHQQRINQGIQQLEIAVKNPDTPAIAWFILGSLQIETKHTQEGMKNLQVYLEKTASDASPEAQNNRERSYLELAQAEADLGRLPAAQKWIDQINDPEIKIPALKAYIGLLAQDGQYNEAFKAAAGLPTRTPQESVQKTLLQAQILMQAKRWRQAYDLLDKASVTPDADLLYLQAMAAERIGHFPRMESLLRQVITLNPSYAHAYNALGYTLADRNERLPEARELVEKALELDPGNAMMMDSLGWVEFREGQVEKALETLQQAFNEYPDSEVAAHLGEVQWVLGLRDEAMTTWKLAWLDTPDSDVLQQTFKRLRITQRMLNDFTLPPDAVLPRSLPDSDAAAHQSAIYIESLIAKGEWQKLYDLLSPMTQKAEIPALMQLQAVAADQLDNMAEAEKLLRRVMILDPENAMAYNDLGYMLTNRGIRLQEAKELIEKAYALQPDSAPILDSMGWIEFKLGNLSKALEWLQNAYDLDPSIAEIGVHLGEVLWHSGRQAEAMLIWRDVQQQYPDDPDLKETLERLKVTLP